MKPQLLKVSTGPAQSFSVRQDVYPINNRWHYHPEFELIHIKKGNGTQFVGDHIRQFNAGDVLLVGADLPHYWRFDDAYYVENTKVTADVVVAHFCEDFWGSKFLLLPENITIKLILEKAKRGVLLTGKTKRTVAGILDKMLTAEGSKRIMLLIEALDVIATCTDVTLLSSIGFKGNLENSENERINAIYEFSLSNFKRKIQLDEIAEVAKISPNSFCRYFKSRTRKTYSRFLIEIKVGHACKLLIENKLNVKQVCYESGFNNFASFHKYFKQVTGKSPLAYQKEFMNG